MSSSFRSRAVVVIPPVLLVLGTVAFGAYLLWRFPYDGFYGVDTYAYYHQALALWNEITGRSQPPDPLFSAGGLQHWPVGFHLLIVVGIALGGGGPEAARIIVLLMAALCPAVVYLLSGRLAPRLPGFARVVAGLAAGVVLPLNATYTRTGLSLMSDVPALFFVLLGVYAFLRVYPVSAEEQEPQFRRWAFAAGLFLGVAVLLRYGSLLIAGPLAVLYLMRAATASRTGVQLAPRGRALASFAFVALGFVAALVPQVLYLLTHDTGSGAGEFIASMSLGNILSRGSVGPDGRASYSYSMLEFYVLGPVWDTAGGFLSVWLLPLVVLGLAYLLWRRSLTSAVFLIAWWVLPAIVYAATPYQAHRFALLYLPAIALVMGYGAGFLAEVLVKANTFARGSAARALVLRVFAITIVLASLVGVRQGWNSTRDWVATHSAWNEQDKQVVQLARAALGDAAGTVRPLVLCFGFSAALYHYTGWRILDIYNADQAHIADFWAGSEPRLALVPEQSMATQWADTPSGERWRWVKDSYRLAEYGTSGPYTVYRVSTPP
jgi:4-amino-4-deoxy-L-arabinose transferase-like glycosyltransferase